MFKFLGTLFKGALFALIVLIAANYLKVGGKTVSDQVRTHLAQAERTETAEHLRGWTGSLAEDSKKAARRIGVNPTHRDSRQSDEIPVSERRKLRDLIEELNRAHERD
jgi:hypothetical protein